MRKSSLTISLVLLFALSSAVWAGTQGAPEISFEESLRNGVFYVDFKVENVPLAAFVRYFDNDHQEGDIYRFQKTRITGSAGEADDAARGRLKWNVPGKHTVRVEIVRGRKVLKSSEKTYHVFSPEIVAIINNMPDGTLNSGALKTLGKYRFIFANNSDSRASLKNLTICLRTSEGVSIQNIGAYIQDQSGSKSPRVNPVDSVATIDVSGLSSADPTQTELVIFGDVRLASPAEFLQTILTGAEYFNGDDYVEPKDSLFPLNGATLSN